MIPHNSKMKQHIGFGKKLIKKAEMICLNENIEKIAIISGIGVRNYYKKLGYQLSNTYMTKKLNYKKKKNLSIF